MKSLAFLFLPVFALGASVERATFESGGGLASLIDHGDELAVRGGITAFFDGEISTSIQPHDQRTPITRAAGNSWSGTTTFATLGRVRFTSAWTDLPNGEVGLNATVVTETDLDLQAIDYVIDLPREAFVGGALGDVGLTSRQPSPPTFYRAVVDQISVIAPEKRWTIKVSLDRPRPVTVTDVWDRAGRSYRIRIGMTAGFQGMGTTSELGLRIKAEAQPLAAAATVRVNESKPVYRFDGFGGNYCWPTETPVVDYTFTHLRSAWSRLEMKASLWDRQKNAPGKQLVTDFELMRRVQQANLPWIISVWRLPERFYGDANQKPMSSFGRPIHPDRWLELLDLFGSYLLYLKQNYGAEPDMFSFNEPDLGVNIGFSPEGHRDMIKRIGAHFAKLGLKTKMLLGDAANPRDSHRYALATAADPEALKYVAGVSFHSWGSGSPAQYRAWADVAKWLGVPLIIGEAGVDPSSFRNRMYDSYAYGLREARQYQELLRDAEPATLLFWQYTDDYSLVRVRADKTVEPTGRFFFMKQFSNLTPTHSEVIETSSSQDDVLVSGFISKAALAIHIVNTGPERDVNVEGLTGEGWRAITTTETDGYVEAALAGTPRQFRIPARSMTTLVKGQP